MEKYLVKLVDGGITNITENRWQSSDGCPTCGWGREWVTDATIYLDGLRIEIEIEESTDCTFSEGDFMRVMCGNYHDIEKMTQQEFYDWFRKQIVETLGNDKYLKDYSQHVL
jgi:hypothetical protein